MFSVKPLTRSRSEEGCHRARSGQDRDRGTPHGAAPPTPPGIRVTYHGGSIGLNLGGDLESGKTEGVEVLVAQGLLDRRVS
jgi:hypothetical protein